MKAQDMDELLGTSARLAIILTLADRQPWTFTALRNETGLADGNLHVQARKLVTAGYLDAEKVQQGNREVTAFRLSSHGWDRLRAYGQKLGQALGLAVSDFNVRRAGDRTPPSAKKRSSNDDSQVW